MDKEIININLDSGLPEKSILLANKHILETFKHKKKIYLDMNYLFKLGMTYIKASIKLILMI